MHKLHEEYLDSLGWMIEGADPLSLEHVDGSIASGQAAHMLIDSLKMPFIKETWVHPDLNLTCSYVNFEPQNYEHVYETCADGVGQCFKPYYDHVKVGDYYVENGAWYGRREEDGFRVLATHELVKCDDSKWEMEESLLERTDEEINFDDDIPF